MTDVPNHTTDAELYSRSALRLASLFYGDAGTIGQFDPVAATMLPDDYRALLAHTEHMTVTLEAFHNSLVDVQVLAERPDETSYARNSLLTRRSDGAVLQFGVMRIWFADLPEAVKREITEERLPLGRVLISHNLLREVELISLWRITPGPVLRDYFTVIDERPVYGRSAQILVADRPTVQMLEIVALAH